MALSPSAHTPRRLYTAKPRGADTGHGAEKLPEKSTLLANETFGARPVKIMTTWCSPWPWQRRSASGNSGSEDLVLKEVAPVDAVDKIRVACLKNTVSRECRERGRRGQA